MTKEITNAEVVLTEVRDRKMFVLKNENGNYYSGTSKCHWTDDINSALTRSKPESIEALAKQLIKYKEKGQCEHLTHFERLFVQEVKLVEVND